MFLASVAHATGLHFACRAVVQRRLTCCALHDGSDKDLRPRIFKKKSLLPVDEPIRNVILLIPAEAGL
jgi:hypothetical protein